MSPWIPRVLIGFGLIALTSSLISISVGNGGPGAPAIIGGVNDVQRILGGLPQEEGYLGDMEAPVTVTVFNDLQCAPCAEFQTETIDPLIYPEDREEGEPTENYVRDGSVRFEFRHFSLAPNDTTIAAIGAEAAGEQSRQWQFVDTFFRNLDTAKEVGVDDDLMHEVAEAVPQIEITEWEKAYADPASAELVREDAILADELKLPAQPAVVVSGPGGQRELIETPSRAEIEAAIEAVS